MTPMNMCVTIATVLPGASIPIPGRCSLRTVKNRGGANFVENVDQNFPSMFHQARGQSIKKGSRDKKEKEKSGWYGKKTGRGKNPKGSLG